MFRGLFHIGLPKCGSTFIQKKIFNNIESHKFKYCLNLKKYDSVIKSHINKLKNNLSINEKFEIDENLIISNERLSGFCPLTFENNAEKNLNFFSADNHIIIIIREPKAFLTSCYVNMINTNNLGKNPDFFFENSLVSPNKKFWIKKFDLESFEYQKLINAYKKRFKKVTIFKFEDLINTKIFNEFLLSYEINFEENLNNLEAENRSPTYFYVKTMTSMFDLINLILRISRLEKLLNYFFKKKFNQDTISINDRFISKLIRLIRLNSIFIFINKYIIRKNYELVFKNKKFYEKLKKLEVEYRNLPSKSQNF